MFIDDKQYYPFLIYCIASDEGISQDGLVTSITVMDLRPGESRRDEESSYSWWKERKEHIFRKKTLYNRIPILKWLPNYTTQDFICDLVAGITVGITVIPQGLAYSTVAGLPPEVICYHFIACLYN